MTRLILPALFIIMITSCSTTLQTEPKYNGRPLNAWVKELPTPESFDQARDEYATNEAVIAVTTIGTNALPYLLKWLQKPDGVGRMHAGLGFIFLGDTAKPAIPELAKLLSNPELNDDATIVLQRLGHDGVLGLTNGLASPEPWVRASTALSFCVAATDYPKQSNDLAVIRFRQERRVAVPTLLTLLQDPNYKVSVAAAYALGDFNQDADVVVPALIRIMNDTNADVHLKRVATNSLSQLIK